MKTMRKIEECKVRRLKNVAGVATSVVIGTPTNELYAQAKAAKGGPVPAYPHESRPGVWCYSRDTTDPERVMVYVG